MVTPEIVVKTEVDFDFIANYTADGDTQNSQSSQSGMFSNCNTKAPSNTLLFTQQSGGTTQQVETMRQQHNGTAALQHEHNKSHNSDDEKLLQLLKEFDLEILYTTLILNDITYRSLMYLTVDDINATIRHIGYRAEFREKLFVWRRQKLTTVNKVNAQTSSPFQPQSATPMTSMVNKKTPTSIVAPAISVQSLQQQQQQQQQQLQNAQSSSSLQTNTNNNNASAIATLTVIPSHITTSSSSSSYASLTAAATNINANPTTTLAATAQTTPTTTATGSATIIKRGVAPAEDFLNLLPGVSVGGSGGVSGTSAGLNQNMPNAVVLEPTLDLRNAFNFMPQTAKSAAAAAPTTTITVPATSISMSSRASTKTLNAEHQFMLAGCNDSGSGPSNRVGEHGIVNRNGSTSTNMAGVGRSSSNKGNSDSYAPKGLLIMNCTKVDTAKVLQASQIGQRIKELYNKNGYLENHERNEIVRLIVADVMRQGETLSPKDLRAILSDIITIFPNEQAAKDYYFIYRGGKGNPLGRLYQRYANENVKRRRMIRISDDDDYNNYDVEMPQQHISPNSNNSLMDEDDTMSTMYSPELPGNVPRVDEMTALALKQLLTTDHFSWEEVCDKWIQTWALRHKELQQSGLSELLCNWSKLGDPRAAELYKIDFRHVYPEKENLLIGKWDEYMKKVAPQLDKKLNHDDLKKLYKYCKMGMASKDEKDFIYAVGLTALLPSTSRFKDQYGKLSIRANLTDSIDSFVMRLNTLESYESRLDLYNRKYGPINRTTHPFLVVIMPNECTISKIYVALENHFYCMQSFLQALDLCYKIYHTCGLKYPTMCENVWTFIQKYFYDMTVPWEARNANLVSLVISLSIQN